MKTFTFKPEMLKIIDKIHGMDYYGYTHDNGYVQGFLDDFDGEIDGKEYFINTLKNGSNILYKSYSLLPSELINSKGRPEITFDFEDSRIFIETGEYPSPEKLQKNSQQQGLIVDTDKIEQLL